MSDKFKRGSLRAVPGLLRNGSLTKRPVIVRTSQGDLVTAIEMGPAQDGSIIELNGLAKLFAASPDMREELTQTLTFLKQLDATGVLPLPHRHALTERITAVEEALEAAGDV